MYTQKNPAVLWRTTGTKSKRAVSYSPALHCSTIGAGGLNFSVRDGKRWSPAAVATLNGGHATHKGKTQTSGV